MTTIEVLRAARALISTPDKWCQGAMSRDADGNDPGVGGTLGAAAYSFCAIGAIHRACRGDGTAWACDALRRSLRVFGGGACLRLFNDLADTDHAAVLRLFDHAIAAEEART